MKLDLALTDIPEGTMRMVNVDGRRLCIVHTSSGIHALDNACPHEGYGLTTGTLVGELVTCAWHNWKFRVTDGRCVQGEENVTVHNVETAADGSLAVTFSPVDLDVMRLRLLDSLRRGIERDYVGQVSRDVIRLLRADANPGELIWEAVAYGAPRGEFGWGHSIASLTDCLGMADRLDGNDRVLPIVQAIAGVAESERGRPLKPLPQPTIDLPANARSLFRTLIEAEQLEAAQALLQGAIYGGAPAGELQRWCTDAVSDHLLAYGHGAIYVQKAFQLLARIGWDRADTVLPHLLPAIVSATREDTLPYARQFLRGMSTFDLAQLAESAAHPAPGWTDDGRLLTALLGPDRSVAAVSAGNAIREGAALGDVLDVVSQAVSERMLRYDVAGEREFHDDFGWLDITHGLTFANAVRYLTATQGQAGTASAPTPDHVRLVMWTAFLAHWTGRHEWHAGVSIRESIQPRSTSLAEYGRLLQHESLQDVTSAFIVHAHGVKMSVAATEEALRMDSPAPLDATARFLNAPRLERFVAATVTRSLDQLSGRVRRE